MIGWLRDLPAGYQRVDYLRLPPSVRPKSVKCGPALQARQVPSMALKTRYGGSQSATWLLRSQLAELTRQFRGREIRQHAGNRHRHMGEDLALLRQRHPAAGGDKLVGRQRHIISVAPEHHQIMRVVGVAGGDGAAQLTPAFKQGDLRRRLMAAVAVLDPDQTEAGG